MTIRCTLASVVFLAGCGGWLHEEPSYVNYFTGETCSPNPLTFLATDADQSNGNVSPTGIPGDNMDDTRSGKVDCYYDGNSGQGDDKKHPECNLEDFPQPGCDDNGCCEDCDEPSGEDPGRDPGNDPGGDKPGSDPGGDKPGSDPGGDDPGSDPGGDDPGSDPGGDDPGSDPGGDDPGSNPGGDDPGNDPPPGEEMV